MSLGVFVMSTVSFWTYEAALQRSAAVPATRSVHCQHHPHWFKVKNSLLPTGQDGSYLAECLLENGYIAHGIKRQAS